MRVILTILTLMLAAGLAVAAIINVPGDYTTIQAGINAAVDGDTVLIADGVYTGTGNKNLDFNGKAIWVMSENGADNCIIDCQNSGRGFYFHNGETSSSILIGLTIKNGSMGGFFLYNCEPVISHCIIKDHNTTGIICSASDPTIEYCVISGNSTGSTGGGISCSFSNPTISNCTFYGNNAHTGGAIALSNNSTPIINSCIISYNTVSG